MRRLIIALAFLAGVLPALAQDVISTVIGGGPGFMPALDANLNDPFSVAVDSAGNYYIAAYNQNRVFKVDTTGTLTVLAGLGIAGYAGDGVVGGAASALLNGPQAVAVDGAGNVYIAEYNNETIRKVDTSHTITTIAGVQGSCAYNGDGSPATSFKLCHPEGIVADNAGNLFIGDTFNCRVRKLVLGTSTISTYAGTGTCGFSGDAGLATSANINAPTGMAVDTAANIYFSDFNNFRVREVTKSSGNITTIAGTGSDSYGGDGGLATNAAIAQIYALAVDGAGTTVTLAGYNIDRIRQFTIGGNISTVGGKGVGGFCGDGALAINACISNPAGVAVSSSGTVYVADSSNERIRQFTVNGNITTIAGNGSTTMPTIVNGIPPLGVVLNYPWDVYEDPSGNVFVSDQDNCIVRELVKSSNVVNTFAGNGTCGDSGDGGLANAAELNRTYGVARDSAGNIYIADTQNHIIRQVNTAGTISTFAGQPGLAGYSGDGGPATSAKLFYPYGVYVDGNNNVYIADTSNQRIRKVTGGVITTIAGNGQVGFLGDGDPATAAELYNPHGLSGDGAGDIYIADYNNCRIREVSALTGLITTVAGDGTCGYSGDGLATSNSLNAPDAVLSDVIGNLFIADTNNQRLRWVDLSGNMTTFAGTGTAGYTGDGLPAFNAELYFPSGITQDATGNFLVADQYNQRVRGISVFGALNSNTSAVSFGIVTVGLFSNFETVTLSAVGSVTITNISVTGDFGEFDNCGVGLTNARTCTVFLYFKPSSTGLRTGTLTIQNNGFFSQVKSISLAGTGSAILISGNPLAFGNQASKTTSAAKTVTVTNKGATSITMGTIGLTETTDFAISSNTCPASGQPLAAAASCTIKVVFKPQSTGNKKGVLSIGDSDPSSPQLVGMTGTGVSTVVLSPATVTFPTQPVGVTTPVANAMKVTLTNNTGASLTLSNPAITITGPFSKINATSCTNSLVIASGGTCSIYLLFTPTAVGYPTGTLIVKDNNATSPQIVPLSGTASGVLFTPSSVNFGVAKVGQQVSSTVTITNVGLDVLHFTAWTVSGPNSPDFTSDVGYPPCLGSLAPAAVCTFTTYFKPSLVGVESANLLVFDNSPGSPQVLPFTGTGQ